MKSNIDIEQEKSRFLARYNPDFSEKAAIKMAINAAVQHNKLYSFEDNSLRRRFREIWEQEIRNFSKIQGFTTDANMHSFNVTNFRNLMRAKSVDLLKNNPNHKIDFRFSHAQKSLSVYAKHLWCMNMIPEPAICPVDRIILTKVNAPTELRSWGKIDDAETYLIQFSFIEKAAKFHNLSVSQWELSAFVA